MTCLQDLSVELHELVLQCLQRDDLKACRLINHSVEPAATRILFCVVLRAERSYIRHWIHIACDRRLRSLSRTACIYTRKDPKLKYKPSAAPPGPVPLGVVPDCDRWNSRAFCAAIAMLCLFPRLTSVELDVDRDKLGSDDDDLMGDHEVLESPASIANRHIVPGQVFQALRMRQQEMKYQSVSNLTITLVENGGIPDWSQRSSISEITPSIQRLDIRVNTLKDEMSHPFRHLGVVRSQRIYFWHHLRADLLNPAASNLSHLSLCRDQYWGAELPCSDMSVLCFPHLQSLELGNYVLARNNQLDWMFSTTSLRFIRIRNCPIVSYVALCGFDTIATSQTSDWAPIQHRSPPMRPEHRYRYPTTWSYFLDRMAASLPHLESFELQFASRTGEPQAMSTSSGEALGNRLSAARYAVYTLESYPYGTCVFPSDDGWLWWPSEEDGELPYLAGITGTVTNGGDTHSLKNLMARGRSQSH